MITGLLASERATLGLPIRLVVLTTIGLIGFAVIVAAIANTPQSPKPVYALSNVSNMTINTTGNSSVMLITVQDFEEEPVPGCNVILRDPSNSVAVAGTTDVQGQVQLQLINMSIPYSRQTGYISIRTLAEGYMDYNDGFFVKVTKSS